MNEDIDLPCDVSAEQYILCALMTDESWHQEIFSRLKANDFSLEKHQLIFKACETVRDAGKPIARGTVAQELLDNKQLNACGGISYLLTISEGMPKILILKHFIKTVLDKSQLRKLLTVTTAIEDRAVIGHDSADQIIQDYADQLSAIRGSSPVNGFQTVGEVIEEIGMDSILNSRKRGISTGFSGVDFLLGGLHAGDLVLIAGRPAMGKSAFAMNIAANLALHNQRVAVISLEMSKQSLLHRMIFAEARVPGNDRQFADLAYDDRKRIHEFSSRLAEPQLHILDRNSMDINEIVNECHKLKLRSGLDVVILDYLQLIGGEMRKDQNRTLQVGEQARTLKSALAKDLNVCVIALSQLSRASETRPNHRPLLSDLRDSGELEQHADTVCFLYREEVYQPREDSLKGKAELIVAKQRNGPVGFVPLTFLAHLAKFESAANEL